MCSAKPESFTINTTPHDNHLDKDVETYLKQQFSHELDLYNFCKQRLYKQYIAIKKTELLRYMGDSIQEIYQKSTEKSSQSGKA